VRKWFSHPPVKTVRTARNKRAHHEVESFDSIGGFDGRADDSSCALSDAQPEPASLVQYEAGVSGEVADWIAPYEASGASQDEIDHAARRIDQQAATSPRGRAS
jgi:hypothetical protein